MQNALTMLRRRNVVRFETRDVRDAHRIREALEANVHQCQHQQAELRLTLMQTRIRLAEVRATLRRISDAMQSR
jgi:hypothetical protein